MTLPCPDPKWAKWWKDFERWCLAGRLPAERPKSLPKSIPLRAYTCFRALHPARPADPYRSLGVYARAAFFINSTAGSPVGGAKEILAGAASAGMTARVFNVGDPNNWSKWVAQLVPASVAFWARCDTAPRCAALQQDDVANIESPEISAGFCTPAHARELVGTGGGIITEGLAPHTDWRRVNAMPVWLEIDINEPRIRQVVEEKGVGHLVEYAHSVGIAIPIPAFFCNANPWWNGSDATFANYWQRIRATWPAPLPFGLYAAELVPNWSVVR